jgi:hypothetical protein
MSSSATSPYAGYRFPAEIISHAVWLYFRFLLTYPFERSGSFRIKGLETGGNRSKGFPFVPSEI